ncbi:methylglyoxal synthase [Yinghuangia seranimata]|uniref:methylglyoxal synthase n=1 Tax=Yinghuangia seranimata TaxID=408067 RepID=UPI00248BF2FF|nr:methylglyoxal synthase [Yinghuangia seranimata]MDI2125979.1 methylglyoxal synthase [Yinghuangia seranimata]
MTDIPTERTADTARTADTGLAEPALREDMGIALVAHDSCKPDMVEWTNRHRDVLARHRLYATGTTGGLVADATGLDVVRFRSGPLGGDQQVGARIAEGEVDLLIFFWDALTAQPHEPDVRALLRLAVLANVAVACNRSTADLIITSPLLGGSGHREPVEHRLAGRFAS